MTTYAELSQEERTRLRAAFDAGFAIGSGGRACPRAHELADLLDAIEDDWFVSREIPPADAEPPIWLQAEIERVAALGDARPPEGWETAPLKRPA
jgi:hypothetical protein